MDGYGHWPAGLGPTLAASRRAYGAVMGRYGPLWAVMGRYGPLWAVMGRYGPLWAAMGRHGTLLGGLGNGV